MSNTNLIFEMVHTVRACAKKVKKRFEDEKLGLSLEQHFFLMVLSAKEECIQSDLAELVEKDKSAVMRHIDTLEAEKFVVRISDKTDRRKKFLVLTKPGMEMLEKANKLVEMVSLEIEADINEKDMETYKRVLNKLHQNAEK